MISKLKQDIENRALSQAPFVHKTLDELWERGTLTSKDLDLILTDLRGLHSSQDYHPESTLRICLLRLGNNTTVVNAVFLWARDKALSIASEVLHSL